LKQLIIANPGAVSPELSARLMTRLSDWNNQVATQWAVIPDVQNRLGKEHLLLSTGASRKTQPSVRQIWPEGMTVVPCYVCDKHINSKNANVGHIVPSKSNKNGTNELHNLEIMCRDCNMLMGATDADAWKEIHNQN
jgi:hypothetical protein